ncbi:APC family permease [Lachnospiraceae bacterium OttesenSCG-928-D06]|nr:APC family permease [Lachnospiraceae bacterium OttesenSCG-928-D06]
MKEEKKKLGRFDIYSLGVGGAIGSGIFVLLGLGIGFTGRSIFLAVGIGCVYMLLAYLFHPIMSSLFVLPGGDYDMKVMLMGPTLTGVNAFFTYFNGLAMAMYAIAMVDYAKMVFPGIEPYSKIIAVAIMTLFFASTIKGSKFVSMIVNVMTIVLLVSIGTFLVVGLPQIQDGFLSGEGFFLNGGIGFIQAISIMSWACQGTTMAPVSMMGTTKNARRIIPTTIILITITVGVVYALMAVVASGVLPVEEVAGQNLAMVAEAIFPGWLFPIFIIGGAVFAIATSLLGGVQMLRYPCMQVAEDGWMPAVFKKTTKGGFPWVIQLSFYTVSVLPIIFNFSLDAIVSLVMIPSMLFNAYLNIKLIKVVKEYPKQWETSVFHMPTPLFNILCVLGTGCALVVAYNLFITLTLTDMIVCICIITLCVVLSIIRLRTGAVTKEALAEKREKIAQAAIELTVQNEAEIL